jgi:hypothetical protein
MSGRCDLETVTGGPEAVAFRGIGARARSVEPSSPDAPSHFEPIAAGNGSQYLGMLVLVKTMAHLIRRGSGLVLGSLLAAGCGNGDDLDPNAGDAPPVMIQPAEVTPEPVTTGGNPPIASPPDPGVGQGGTGSVGSGGGGGVDLPPRPVADPNACVTPLGVSGTPRDLEEAVALMNALPRPTSLECFLQALSRPLNVYMTSSGDSLQPAVGERSPRTFIVFEPLVMSIVFGGPGRSALELGYRTTPTRSIKTEFVFPLTTDVTATNFFRGALDAEDSNATKCSACHTGEVLEPIPEFPGEVFESDIFPPYDFLEVSVEELRSERERCDAVAEPERCSLLSAFFDFGTISPAPQGIMF